MKIKKTFIKYKKKVFPAKIYIGNNPKNIFVTHHGILSNKNSYKYFEDFIKEDAIIVNFDARGNGENKMKASRMASTYVRDLRDVIRWTKENFPNIPIITLGSSWGASIVINYAKKYKNKDVYKNIAWSIPYNFIKNPEKTLEKRDKKGKKYETSYFGYFWKFLLMIFLNLNTKTYTKINIKKITENKTIRKINKNLKEFKTPTKLFWSAYKNIIFNNKKLKKINKNNKNIFLYFQNINDGYLTKNKLKELKEIDQKGVKIIFLNNKSHALQWEKENNFHILFFEQIIKWINKK